MACIRSEQGETVDQIAVRFYGDPAMTTRIYEANPGLADLGPLLPQGTPVQLPPMSAPLQKRVSLWD
jgi:phage tail protein X